MRPGFSVDRASLKHVRARRRAYNRRKLRQYAHSSLLRERGRWNRALRLATRRRARGFADEHFAESPRKRIHRHDIPKRAREYRTRAPGLADRAAPGPHRLLEVRLRIGLAS